MHIRMYVLLAVYLIVAIVLGVRAALVSGPAQTPIPSSTPALPMVAHSFTPPGTSTKVSPVMTLAAINTVLRQAGAGNTVVFAAGTYPRGVIAVPSGVYVYSQNACAAVLSGNVVLGSHATLDGFSLQQALVDIRDTTSTRVGNNCFNGGAPADPGNPSSYPGNLVVWADNAQKFLIVDNTFNDFPGAGVYGWRNSGRVAGNQFLRGREAVDLNFTSTEIDHNYASGLTRMFVEIGANNDGDTSSGVSVHDNYEENLNPISDPGAGALDDAIAYSVVPAQGKNNLIQNNVVTTGVHTCALAVELNNAGVASGNYGVNCEGGVAVYGTQPQTVTNNIMMHVSWWVVGNVDHNPSLITSGNTSSSSQPLPAKPGKVAWR